MKPSSPQDQDSSRFVALTPCSDADADGKYTKALNFALEKDDIKNIALTGSYGAGKSSIIKTFEKKNHKYNFLNISLASFEQENTRTKENKIDDVLIERSILQQMFYGSQANNLPFSRFKRISYPELPLVKSALFILWLLSLVLLYQFGDLLLSLPPFSSLYFFSIFLISFALSVPIVLGADCYKAMFGFSFKKLSLINAEIEIENINDASILNKYIDEIIYFFQECKCNVVVIEDLDRFGSPEIFIKLREINKLINDNDKTSGKIKFIYALRDDMFANADRTKFFDFIIPILPIINSSNAFEVMKRRLNDKTIKKKFLQEISLYIYDMRLIQNTFNEFFIYQANVGSDKLDKTSY